MLARTLKRFAADQSGATAIEYALLGTLVAVALVASFTLVGNSIGNLFGAGTGGATEILDSTASTL